MIKLRGMTWDHSRGYTSIVGVSQRYEELHPEVSIEWSKRSLSDFESAPVGQLAADYDLLVIDHPWAGYAAKNRALLPLQEVLDVDFLDDQRSHSVGASYESYNFDGFQSALAIDAASPVSVWRPDKLAASQVPTTMAEVLDLARQGSVVYAATPQYLLMDFYALCVSAGGNLFPDDLGGSQNGSGGIVDREVGAEALEDMRQLAQLCSPEIFKWNPIQMHEELAASDRFAYCPSVYGYVNYSRRGYARHRIAAGPVPTYRGHRVKGVLGGTGLAISAKTEHPQACADFVQCALSPRMQTTLYTECGGQPGYLDAWKDESNNEQTLNFFRNTLSELETAWIRPRYNGYLYFQDRGGAFVRDYVRDGGKTAAVLDQLDELYRESKMR